MTKLIETAIGGQDAAFYVTVTFDDQSFSHEFGTERQVSVDFDVEHCEGCEPQQALAWCNVARNRQRLIDLAEKEAEDSLAV